jgi:hypothetical protein
MNFNMTTPCPECPFRNDIPGYLTKAMGGGARAGPTGDLTLLRRSGHEKRNFR